MTKPTDISQPHPPPDAGPPSQEDRLLARKGSYLDDGGLFEAQKKDLLLTLWSIMVAFVDLACSVKPGGTSSQIVMSAWRMCYTLSSQEKQHMKQLRCNSTRTTKVNNHATESDRHQILPNAGIIITRSPTGDHLLPRVFQEADQRRCRSRIARTSLPPIR